MGFYKNIGVIKEIEEGEHFDPKRFECMILKPSHIYKFKRAYGIPPVTFICDISDKNSQTMMDGCSECIFGIDNELDDYSCPNCLLSEGCAVNVIYRKIEL